MDEDGEVNPMDEEDFEQMFADERSAFHGFYIGVSGCVHQPARQQAFYPTLWGRYHGLSRIGQTVLAQYGYLMPLSTYDRSLLDLLNATKLRARSRLKHMHR
jgi:hypothetical protein